jgi:hypothetical protein
LDYEKKKNEDAPTRGFEPPSFRLTAERSASELQGMDGDPGIRKTGFYYYNILLKKKENVN